jgi:hypothetical protein
VHATVSHGDLTVQLFAANSDGRDALRGLMTDLHRDLSAGADGTTTTLSLGSGDAPQQDTRGQQSASWTGDAGFGGSAGSGGRSSREDSTPVTTAARAVGTSQRTPTTSSTALLDVLA